MSPGVLFVGDIMIDVVVDMPSDLEIGSDLPSEISTTFGGTAANAAAWCAAMGGSPTLIGCVGDDQWAGLTRSHLDALGVKHALRSVAGAPTGMVVVLSHPNGERSMLPDARANAALAEADFDSIEWSDFAWLYVSGYTLMNATTTATALDLIRRARAAGLKVAIDPASSAPLAQCDSAALKQWLNLADLLLPNEQEAAVLSVLLNAANQDGCDVVVKHGAAGIEVRSHGAISTLPALPVSVVDTVGAGDAFAGGLLAALGNGSELLAACDSGLRSAGAAVSQRGAQPQSQTA